MNQQNISAGPTASRTSYIRLHSGEPLKASNFHFAHLHFTTSKDEINKNLQQLSHILSDPIDLSFSLILQFKSKPGKQKILAQKFKMNGQQQQQQSLFFVIVKKMIENNQIQIKTLVFDQLVYVIIIPKHYFKNQIINMPKNLQQFKKIIDEQQFTMDFNLKANYPPKFLLQSIELKQINKLWNSINTQIFFHISKNFTKVLLNSLDQQLINQIPYLLYLGILRNAQIDIKITEMLPKLVIEKFLKQFNISSYAQPMIKSIKDYIDQEHNIYVIHKQLFFLKGMINANLWDFILRLFASMNFQE